MYHRSTTKSMNHKLCNYANLPQKKISDIATKRFEGRIWFIGPGSRHTSHQHTVINFLQLRWHNSQTSHSFLHTYQWLSYNFCKSVEMNELLATVIIQYNKNNVKKLVNKVNMIWIAYETDKTTSRCEVCPQDIK